MEFFKPMSFDISLWERLNEERHAFREAMRLETLAKTIESLRSYFSNKKVDKVFITGSVLRECFFYDFSDIDIAVEGLKESYFITLSELEELLQRQVDLIELENSKISDSIKNKSIQIK